ncbi:MAG: radical SAM protein, partial [Clostridia bacterium]|nr:radical SAM protein [Clostridia bacterium]
MSRTIACHTLGCKVNQYDTQAMLELFENSGYTGVPFDGEADVYLINTCTVTGTGDQKSLKAIRRVHREHPQSDIIVAGCLAQRDQAAAALPGVRLIIGAKRRGEVVELYEKARRGEKILSAIETGGEWEFENLAVSRHEGKTRAVMKIQEGCDRYCAYCIIPYVRGPVRSMSAEAVKNEAARLARAGYKEIVVTGIHLASYGKGSDMTLLDAVEAIDGV